MAPEVSNETAAPVTEAAGNSQCGKPGLPDSFTYTEPSAFERAWARLMGMSAQLTALHIAIEDHANGGGSGIGCRVQCELLYGMQMSIDDIKRDITLAVYGRAS